MKKATALAIEAMLNLDLQFAAYPGVLLHVRQAHNLEIVSLLELGDSYTFIGEHSHQGTKLDARVDASLVQLHT